MAALEAGWDDSRTSVRVRRDLLGSRRRNAFHQHRHPHREQRQNHRRQYSVRTSGSRRLTSRRSARSAGIATVGVKVGSEGGAKHGERKAWRDEPNDLGGRPSIGRNLGCPSVSWTNVRSSIGGWRLDGSGSSGRSKHVGSKHGTPRKGRPRVVRARRFKPYRSSTVMRAVFRVLVWESVARRTLPWGSPTDSPRVGFDSTARCRQERPIRALFKRSPLNTRRLALDDRSAMVLRHPSQPRPARREFRHDRFYALAVLRFGRPPRGAEVTSIGSSSCCLATARRGAREHPRLSTRSGVGRP